MSEKREVRLGGFQGYLLTMVLFVAWPLLIVSLGTLVGRNLAGTDVEQRVNLDRIADALDRAYPKQATVETPK